VPRAAAACRSTRGKAGGCLRSEKRGTEKQERSHGGRGEKTLPSLPDRACEDDDKLDFVDAHEQHRGIDELDLRPGDEGSEPAAAQTPAAPPKIWHHPKASIHLNLGTRPSICWPL
jgi:hypothetical protein